MTAEALGAPMPGQAPCGLAIAETRGGTYALIGDHTGNQVRSLRLDRSTGLLAPVGASRVTSVAVHGRLAAAGTIGGEIHGFLIGPQTLIPLGSFPTGGDITDIGFSPRGTLFVTGGSLGVWRRSSSTATSTATGSSRRARSPYPGSPRAP